MATAIKTKKRTAAGNNGSRKKATLSEANADRIMEVLSTLVTRSAVSAYLGKSYSGDRDLYTALGYKKLPQYEDYLSRYERQDIARAIIDAPVRACWRHPPTITESGTEETPFEQAWVDLVDKRAIYHYLSRVDRLASIGQYAILLLGFDDGTPLDRPVTRANDLLYLMPYGQDAVTIDSYEQDARNERFGLPVMYNVNISIGTLSSVSKQVHWTRVIHVSEDNLSSDTYGTPRLQAVLNRLQDIELISGGSAEMFWRGALPGLAFKVDKDARLGTQDLTKLQDEIDAYMHGLKRYLRLQGISVEGIAQQIADPSAHINILVDLIAAAVRIPKRILLGSERGELASTQDERNWAQRVDERRREHCEAKILRPLIDRLVTVGVLPEPEQGYTVAWPDLMTPSEKDKADVAETRARAIKHYVEAVGAQDLVPPKVFLQHILGFDQDVITQIEDTMEEIAALADDIEQQGHNEHQYLKDKE
jgi:hypothetical protein